MNGGEWLSLIIVALIGCFIVLVFINFDKFRIKFLKYKDDDCYGPFFVELMFKAADKGGPVAENISNAFKDVLDKKTEHFSILTQGSISVLIVICVTILIILGKVDAAAGLPIISGVAGYFIAKVPQKSDKNKRNQ